MLGASKKGRVWKNDREATRAENERIEMTNRTDKKREASIGERIEEEQELDVKDIRDEEASGNGERKADFPSQICARLCQHR